MDNDTNLHKFQLTTFHSFTYCDKCSKLLWGMAKQGYLCTSCGLKCHEACIKDIKQTCKPKTDEEFPNINYTLVQDDLSHSMPNDDKTENLNVNTSLSSNTGEATTVISTPSPSAVHAIFSTAQKIILPKLLSKKSNDSLSSVKSLNDIKSHMINVPTAPATKVEDDGKKLKKEGNEDEDEAKDEANTEAENTRVLSSSLDKLNSSYISKPITTIPISPAPVITLPIPPEKKSLENITVDAVSSECLENEMKDSLSSSCGSVSVTSINNEASSMELFENKSQVEDTIKNKGKNNAIKYIF